MTTQTDYIIGQMRVQTMPEQLFFYVVCPPIAMDRLDEELNRLMPLLGAARAEAHVGDGAPVIINYYPAGEAGEFAMEVGIPVKAGAGPAGEAQVKILPVYRCAALLYWGSLEHIQEAYDALMKAIGEAGLERTGKGREWYYHFEGDASPNNVIGLHIEVQ
ncbi:MAG: GyrI-like domain-containing protein [Anaerolineae bacterium]|nr:GyrI-like domain-containing protein [Anaerolineae bacterium]